MNVVPQLVLYRPDCWAEQRAAFLDAEQPIEVGRGFARHHRALVTRRPVARSACSREGVDDTETARIVNIVHGTQKGCGWE